MNDKYSMEAVAYAGLLHDIGKFYQRTLTKSDLTEDELKMTPFSKEGKYHTHLHSGYTSRFLHEFLGLNDAYEFYISSHHNQEFDELAEIIKKADQIASKIDRKDESSDNDVKNKTGNFITARMSSILSEIDFGKDKYNGTFELSTLSNLKFPIKNFEVKNKELSAKEYKLLFTKFTEEIKKDILIRKNKDKYSFNRMYALMKEYCSTIPASTYEGNSSSVSLFDHSKLTAAIASCLYNSNEQVEKFCVLEFDISGIQNFIFKITEGNDNKKEVAKSLRGRSLFVGLLSNYIAYSYLYEFSLTQANIIFNTGGGALLLLPNSEETETKINNISNLIKNEFKKAFGSDITFVFATTKMNEKELDLFKVNNALELKLKIENEKKHKFSSLLNEEFFIEREYNKDTCSMCENVFVDKKSNKDSAEQICSNCKKILQISDFYTKNEELMISYHFNNLLDISSDVKIEFSNGVIAINRKKEDLFEYDYVDSINNHYIGDVKYVANSVPIKNNQIINLESISRDLLPNKYGDKKLGILKMDVDNLGAVFAFGLKQEIEGSYQNYRSLSKYLTLSRLIENFFSIQLLKICKEISLAINPNINEVTDNGTMFYINYAGGDDLVILGPAYAIIRLALKINEKFNEFTLNENITISGGIQIQSPKYPIRFGILESEKQLELSKALSNKNGLTLMNTTIPFKECDKFFKEVSDFVDYMDTDVISRSTLYNLMSIINDVAMDRYISLIPKILYSITRNVKEHYRDNIKKKFLAIKTNDDLEKFVLIIKLSMMITRREK